MGAFLNRSQLNLSSWRGGVGLNAIYFSVFAAIFFASCESRLEESYEVKDDEINLHGHLEEEGDSGLETISPQLNDEPNAESRSQS